MNRILVNHAAEDDAVMKRRLENFLYKLDCSDDGSCPYTPEDDVAVKVSFYGGSLQGVPAATACEHMSVLVQSSKTRARARRPQLSPSSVYAPELLADVLQQRRVRTCYVDGLTVYGCKTISN
ncbi:hypothetical protein EVAR_9755_1 [Eumeta japonica]|uniref:Uncharacterized protein n=1 Tax=Eumeta variegata TaxID=151549 RepID=A0A4C1U5N5_EUMVA|nr:hypothetical protein EVAR_9755_1 [Eumeta japonica]